MTIAELIEALKKEDPHALVFTEDNEWGLQDPEPRKVVVALSKWSYGGYRQVSQWEPGQAGVIL